MMLHTYNPSTHEVWNNLSYIGRETLPQKREKERKKGKKNVKGKVKRVNFTLCVFYYNFKKNGNILNYFLNYWSIYISPQHQISITNEGILEKIFLSIANSPRTHSPM